MRDRRAFIVLAAILGLAGCAKDPACAAAESDFLPAPALAKPNWTGAS